MKRVLITGAAGGLGAVLAASFLEAGWRVAGGWHHAKIESEDDRLERVQLDVSEEDSVCAAIGQLTRSWGGIDCLVNNAGLAVDRTLARLEPSDWERVLEVNLKGLMRCCRAVLPGMLRRGDGHIVNVSSYAARGGAAGQAAYAAAKAGVIGFSQALAREGGERNVRVNVVLPGVLRTAMTSHLSEEQRAAFARANVLGRLNHADEVARFVVFLAGTGQISGQVFSLDSRIGPWA